MDVHNASKDTLILSNLIFGLEMHQLQSSNICSFKIHLKNLRGNSYFLQEHGGNGDKMF